MATVRKTNLATDPASTTDARAVQTAHEHDMSAIPWRAELALNYHNAGGRTVPFSHHAGPLRVQKPFYPEGDAVCHTILIHPPGGIAGGDALSTDVNVERGAHALLTTPGATRWYKANGQRASQQVHLKIRGSLEWLPQEAIVFDAADVWSAIEIDLDEGAATIGWDLIALGRRAAGEAFAHGRLVQSIRLCAGGELLWHERTRLDGGDALLDSPIGLAGCTVFGCMWTYGPAWSDHDLEAVRAALVRQGVNLAVTRVSPQLLLARALVDSAATARGHFAALWSLLRPIALDRTAVEPRIWRT
jgi:urease accessory protein